MFDQKDTSQQSASPDIDHITLYVLSTRQQISIPLKPKIILGRAAQSETDDTLYVDLTPYYGHQLGVSRRHLMLVEDEEHDLMVFDLNSQNGSYLNGKRMSSHKGYPVADGDEITLGSLSIRVYCTDEVPFSQTQTARFTGASSQHPETHAPLPFPQPNIRETLTTRPLRRDDDAEDEQE